MGPDRTAAVRSTAIPGLLVVDLILHGDDRGWFKENWQRAKMTQLGLPDFGPVQHSVAMNHTAGVTRGFHAEPWDKLVSIASGRIFGAWVDLRAGATFGTAVTMELGPDTAVFVPRGVANGYQTLNDETVYSYLVNDHWSPEKRDAYAYVNLADETLAIPWPIPLSEATMSDADVAHPRLVDAQPAQERGTVVIGAGGQLGGALMARLPKAVGVTRTSLDLGDPNSFTSVDWSQLDTIINAAAYTAVDDAETGSGRQTAWATNVTGVAQLCRIAAEHRITLVHVSSDYVFDGTAQEYDEYEPPSPLGVYGQTKAAGDALVGQLDSHLLLRTSWVIGEGRNFVSTMVDLALRGISPTVVNDQFGRLTFTEDLAAGIAHLLDAGAPSGTWNLTNAGPVQTWADIAADVFELCGRDRKDVRPVTTQQYALQQPQRLTAPRPRRSALRLDRIVAAGFQPPEARERLTTYVAALLGAR
ncbi:sugar nucleotide-binding protein [Tessaracoccus antarcticus]|uniref:dTDP-4-dehydrorhamnose reductase n=1 Tax=Tessaracoccus antarcticus TaxID=2479848 RepID=A0A3M0G210_9ACTN|nr:sugar nucleotide-binding protein [Tessaracoccus antarcticus]RMB58157.1 NAD-dependent epimerase/dehydratase family protein [Tessaracoccus antarcticus]